MGEMTTPAEPTPAATDDATADPPAKGGLAMVLSGGGARAAYQVGLLRSLGRRFPGLRFPVLTGVSAGAINAAFLAAHPRPIAEAAQDLSELWSNLDVEDVFEADFLDLARNFIRWSLRLVSGGSPLSPQVRGLVDTSPLRSLLERAYRAEDGRITGIARNIAAGHLRSVALTALDYGTGKTINWVEGCDTCTWESANRRSISTELWVDHVMASSALPLFFPAAEVEGAWYGDGGIRLAAPLSPALHLGADRILAVSTRYARSWEEADEPYARGYPAPAQILGHLMKAIFLDVLDRDVGRLERLNGVLEKLPPEERGGLKTVKVVLLRPSRDLGKLAAGYEVRLPKAFRFLTRGLGTRESSSPDFLSIMMFQPDYLRALIELGEEDAEARADEVAEIVEA